MKKIIIIPSKMDMGVGEKVWDLLRSDEFSKLRCGFQKDLSPDELNYLRKQFEPFCVLTEDPMGRQFVEEQEEITVRMMLEASYELTKFEVSK